VSDLFDLTPAPEATKPG